MTHYFVYCLTIRVILFVIQKASKPYFEAVFKGKTPGFLSQLFGCDLCLGVWLYTFGAWFLDVNILYEYGYVPVVSEFVTGMITSFIVWLVRNGWQSQFSVIWADHQE